MRKTTYEWADEKDKENQAKHGISFLIWRKGRKIYEDQNKIH
jgi:uncharacterized DUF497 family protein